jgi:hypothetical protein
VEVTAVKYIEAAPLISTQDEVDDTNDSAFGGDDDLSDTYSVASMIFQHRYENGRRYHAYKEGAYWYAMLFSVWYCHLIQI